MAKGKIPSSDKSVPWCDPIDFSYVDRVYAWRDDSTEEERISDLCGKIADFCALANLPMEDDDLVPISMSFLVTYIHELSTKSQAEIIRVLAFKLGFDATLRDMEKTDG